MTNEKPQATSKSRPKTSPKKPSAKVSVDVNASKPTDKVRLQRALAAAGYGSRRQCEELIIEGRVHVDGQIVSELGVTVQPSQQKIYVDGTPLKARKLVYYALNKPTGIVTTNVDPEGRPRVIDLVPPDERVFPVGRLDRSSEGLILLTNDGELAQRLAHPRYEVSKVYRVTVAGKVDAETLRKMERGIYIAEGQVKVEGAKLLKIRGRATELEITLKEGKNREIRRILARLGHKVQQLKRIAIGPLRLGEMPTGAYRKLSLEELKKLKASVEPSNKRAAHDDDNADDASARPPKRSLKKGAPRSASARRSPAGKPVGKSTGKASGKPVGSRTTSVKVGPGRRPLPKKKDTLEISTDRVKVGSIIGADPSPDGGRPKGGKSAGRKGAGKSFVRRDRNADPDNRVTRTSKSARQAKKVRRKAKGE
jgi:23S rRNA pseudouridine2605 synthase